MARTRAREALKTAINFANQILSSSESINPNKMRTQILELEKLTDIAGVPKNSREGVKQIKKALAELETKIAQAKAQSQVKAQAQSEARAKEKAHAIAQAEVKAKYRSAIIKTILLVVFWTVTPLAGIVLVAVGLNTDSPSCAVAGFIGICLPILGIFFVAALHGDSDPQQRNAQIAMIQRQQMMNKIDDIRSDLSDE